MIVLARPPLHFRCLLGALLLVGTTAACDDDAASPEPPPPEFEVRISGAAEADFESPRLPPGQRENVLRSRASFCRTPSASAASGGSGSERRDR